MQTESETLAAQNARPLATQPLGRLMRRYAVPCMTSLVVAALYNMVDQVFIANAPDLGSVGNAATTVVFPLTVAALAIAVMLGDGCCAFVSLMLGAGKQEEAHRAVGGTVTVSVVAGLVLMAAYLLFPDTLLTWFGGRVNAGTFEKAQEYFFWIALGVPLYVFGQAMNPVIRSDGSPTFAMVATLAGAAANLVLDPLLIFVCHFGMAGAAANLVLDPLLIFVCHFGMAGAAIATVAGQALTAGLSIWYLTRMKQIHLQKDSFRPRAHLLGKCAKLGMTSFLAQISLVAAMAATNTMLRICSAQDAVFSQEEFSAIPMAVFGIVMKVFQIVISCAIGLAAGCIPVAGYNMGAGRYDRVKGLLTRLLAAEAVVGLIALLVVELLPDQVMLLFGAQNESIHYTLFARRCFRVYLSMIVLACINKGTFIFLQSLGKAAASTLLSMAREVVFGVGLVLLLPQFFQLDGVIYSMPAADVLTAILSAVVLVRTYRSLGMEK